MLSSYRLGDLVLLQLEEDVIDEILIKYPNSIGSKFILEKRMNYNRIYIKNIRFFTKRY